LARPRLFRLASLRLFRLAGPRPFRLAGTFSPGIEPCPPDLGEHHFHLWSVARPKDGSERPERFKVGPIETTRSIDCDVIDAPVVIFVGSKVVSVLVPIERGAVSVLAGYSFGMRGVDTIANECTANLLGEGERVLSERQHRGIERVLHGDN
jgi:hypothetical protein